MKQIILGVLFVCSMFLACQSAPGVLEPKDELDLKELQGIKNWYIGFEYSNTTVEQVIKENSTEKKIIDYGYSDVDIELLDQIYFNLVNNNVNISKIDNEKSGKIKLHLTMLNSGASIGLFAFYIRIFFYDASEKLVHQTLINRELYGDNLIYLTNEIASSIMDAIQ